MLSIHASTPQTDSSSVHEKQSKFFILTGWIGMGRSGPHNVAKLQLWNCLTLTMVLSCLLLRPAHCQQCRIQRCNAEYVTSTSPSSGLQEEMHPDYCISLRAYALCTRRTARSCRGDLVYHSAVFRIKELFSQHNCSSDGPTSPARAPGTPRPPLPRLCDYESRALAAGHLGRYAHCSLFGDPHLRTFREEFQTCKVEGAWPLIDNRYLSVQVTNVPVVQGSSATATSKITVIFKSFQGCTDQKVYQATTEDLPSAFQDGSSSSGGDEASSLLILDRPGPAGRHVHIQARYLGASIIVRRVGLYLTFAIRVPEDMLGPEEVGLQLCLHGCPRSQLITQHTLGPAPPPRALPPRAPPPQVYSVEQATARCRETLQVEDVYFQSCVFDLLTTGDPAFCLAAFGALQDLKALPPSRLRQSSAPSPPRTPRLHSRGASLPTTHTLLLLLGLLLGLLLV
ncbi:RGM domain family, member D [Osmerus eperlanus]|uniref:RGM domain family, member D n=1 Tax=Osmerus eperlanus TaxID=29151 RepID=UPI002E13CE37